MPTPTVILQQVTLSITSLQGTPVQIMYEQAKTTGTAEVDAKQWPNQKDPRYIIYRRYVNCRSKPIPLARAQFQAGTYLLSASRRGSAPVSLIIRKGAKSKMTSWALIGLIGGLIILVETALIVWLAKYFF